ncbi:MAG: MarR family winged helix-turn-helix transcriptional regulator [Clostridiales bacterium]|nr:MarR family winged helix-turn-helix transcriptional regulator [Clostridiales bacterium]
MQNQSAAHSVSRLANEIRHRLDACSTRSGLSGAQGRALHFILAQEEPVYQRDIEEEFGLRPSTVTELLKKMEQNGLIYRETEARDSRLKRIVVTETALAHQRQVVADLKELEDELTEGVSPGQLMVFFEVMEKMSENLSGPSRRDME